MITRSCGWWKVTIAVVYFTKKEEGKNQSTIAPSAQAACCYTFPFFRELRGKLDSILDPFHLFTLLPLLLLPFLSSSSIHPHFCVTAPFALPFFFILCFFFGSGAQCRAENGNQSVPERKLCDGGSLCCCWLKRCIDDVCLTDQYRVKERVRVPGSDGVH